MKEFIEKLIGRLEERKQLHNRMIAYEQKSGTVSEEFQQRKAVEVLDDAIEIVNQLAEEYKVNDNIMQFVKLLKEICCKEDADYDKAIISPKFLCDTVDTLVMDFVPQNNGWIPCSERLPERNENVLCYAKSTARSGDTWFVGSCDNGFWFLQTAIGTLSYPTQYEIVAWQPLPAPYQKGE